MKAPRPIGEDDEADRFQAAPHPRHASKLIGHVDQERQLLDAYRQNRLPHALILGGPLGVGKATLAWRLTRFLVANPVNSSPVVTTADDLSVSLDSKAAAALSALAHPDVSLLRREVNDKTRRFFTEIRADDVRRAIGLFQRAAGAGGYRICIVDSAEDLNRSSANALLKLIEEPPPLSLFLLIAHRPGMILPTIRSRAQFVRMDVLSAPEIEQVVRTLGPPWADLPAADIVAASAKAQGSVQPALRRLGQGGGDFEQTLRRLLDRLPLVDWLDVHRLADQVGARTGEAAFEVMINIVFEWLSATVHERGNRDSRQLIVLAEVWERITLQVREVDALNLDRRPLALSIFAELAEAVQTTSRRDRPRLAGSDET